MSTDTTKYLSTTEFANRYNAMMPIDKDHMPLEPSFVELLCQKGEIEHSELQPGKGNKKYIYKIPEYELDRVAILINGDEFVKVERALLGTKDVAELLGYSQNHVLFLVKQGKLVPAKTEKHGRLNFYKFDEDYILKYMEAHSKRKHSRKPKTVEAKPESESVPVQESKEGEDLNNYQRTINELLEANRKLQEELDRKSSAEPVAKDIFEAYRKGFKDGYEMGGKH